MTKEEDGKLEEVRAYWNRRPCNIRHSSATIGTEQFFDEVTQKKYFVEPHIPHFAGFEDLRGKRVLEIGCGIGTDTEQFARAGANVVAVDLSDASIAIARQRLEVRKLQDRVSFIVANAEELSSVVRPEPFDLVYSFGVLHHTPNPSRAFEQLPLFMSPTSELRLMLYHRYSTKTTALVLRHGWPRVWEIDNAVAKQSEAEFGCPVTYTYSRRAITRELALCGISVTDLQVDHIFPYKTAPYKENSFEKRLYWRLMPPRIFRSFERNLGWHLLVRGKLGDGSTNSI